MRMFIILLVLSATLSGTFSPTVYCAVDVDVGRNEGDYTSIEDIQNIENNLVSHEELTQQEAIAKRTEYIDSMLWSTGMCLSLLGMLWTGFALADKLFPFAVEPIMKIITFGKYSCRNYDYRDILIRTFFIFVLSSLFILGYMKKFLVFIISIFYMGN